MSSKYTGDKIMSAIGSQSYIKSRYNMANVETVNLSTLSFSGGSCSYNIKNKQKNVVPFAYFYKKNDGTPVNFTYTLNPIPFSPTKKEDYIATIIKIYTSSSLKITESDDIVMVIVYNGGFNFVEDQQNG